MVEQRCISLIIMSLFYYSNWIAEKLEICGQPFRGLEPGLKCMELHYRLELLVMLTITIKPGTADSYERVQCRLNITCTSFPSCFYNLNVPPRLQWAAVFQSSRATCWRSCSTSSCLRNRLRRSCRSIETRLADCYLPSPNRRRRNPDFTRKDPTLTALHPHIGSSGLDVMVSVRNDGQYVGRFDILRC